MPLTSSTEDQNIYRSLTSRYLLAVLIIALLSSSAYYTLHSALSDSDATAYVVNLSGRQRMLSQHIALDAHRFMQQVEQEQADAKTIVRPAEAMLKNVDDMREANRQLSSGLLSKEQTVDLSPTLREMYFGELDVYNRVNDYVGVAEALYSHSDAGGRLSLLATIDANSEQLLKDLHKVVQQYQLEGEQSLASIEKLELIVWLATIIALCLEIVFIFRPMALLVASLQKVQAKALESLEEMVELRTIKLEAANKKLKVLATRDPLTQLKNRLTLESELEELIKLNQTNEIPFAFCMIDIDWFKTVNDRYGHPAGDYVLKRIATLMNDNTREYDHLYRAGGEEFVLVLNRASQDESLGILEKLRREIEKYHFAYDGQIIKVTISVGVYHTSQANLTRVQSITRVADNALYEAKNAGRNCIKIAKDEDLKDALSHDK